MDQRFSIQAGVTTPGTADSFLKASHVSCTRHAHQITAAALYMLMDKAYKTYREGVDEGEEPKSFSDWNKQAELESPQFHYWSLPLHFQLTILIFVRSLREGNFQLYKNACKSLAPWFVALDRIHYARWLPVHIRDMECLETEIPATAAEFKNSNFVVNKTNRAFSSLPIDQAHEQDKIVKGDGGAIGLTESSTQLVRWMVSGPEMSGIINAFELSQELVTNTAKQEEQEDLRHQEQMKGVQNTFRNQVNAVCSTIEEMGNPFAGQTGDLFVLDTRDIADSKVVETVRTVEQLGRDQYQ